MSTAISPSLRTPRPKPQTDYSQLLKTIQQAGLMKRRYGYYAVKCSLMMLAVLAELHPEEKLGVILAGVAHAGDKEPALKT